MEKGTGKHLSNSVYSINGLSPCVMAGLGIKQTGLFIVVEDKDVSRSSEVQKFRSSEVQKFRSSEDCTDSKQLVNTHSLLNICGKLDKKSSAGDGFLSADKHGIYDVGCDLASTVTARYYKGLSAHGDNLVIVRIK